MMKFSVLVAIALIAVSNPVMAQDNPWSFDGFYAGVLGTYAEEGSGHDYGPLGTGMIGYRLELGDGILAGVEGHLSVGRVSQYRLADTFALAHVGTVVDENMFVFAEAGVGARTFFYAAPETSLFALAGAGIEVAINSRASLRASVGDKYEVERGEHNLHANAGLVLKLN